MTTKRSITGRAFAAAVAAAMLSGTAFAVAPAIAHADPANCPSTFSLFIPGTWEIDENADPNQSTGMLAPIAEAVEKQNGSTVQTYTLPYMARAFDNGKTYADSKSDGLNKATAVLSEIAAKCSNTKFTLTGYSQGADVAGDLASAIGNGSGPIAPERVLGVALLADPGSGTKGEAVVGPRTAGNGIADPRPQGMGKLSGRVASICDPKDMYCSINKGDNTLFGALGSILSKSPSAGGADTTGVGGNSRVATALTSDFSAADLPALGTEVSNLTGQLANGNVDLTKVADTATKLSKTISPMADLLASGAANPAATSQLAAQPAGSPKNAASEVLANAGQSDLSGALQTVNTIADTATTLANKGTASAPSTSSDVASLALAADSLTGQIAPLASTPGDVLGNASSVLSVLKPSVVVNQVLTVATGVTSLDFPAILNNLNLLPQKIAALDVQGAHKIAGDLNNQFNPLVKMAAGVDLRWVSQVLSIIPDPSGYAQIAAMVTSILANVDVIRLANLVGQIQEVGWSILEGNLAAAAGLLPIGLDLASVATNMLSGKVTKTDPSLLGKQSTTAATSITSQAQTLDLPGLTNSLTAMATSPGADDLAKLVGEGFDVAQFFTSGAHQSYGSLVVDNAGRNAITWISDWLNLQITRAA